MEQGHSQEPLADAKDGALLGAGLEAKSEDRTPPGSGQEADGENRIPPGTRLEALQESVAALKRAAAAQAGEIISAKPLTGNQEQESVATQHKQVLERAALQWHGI